MKGQDILDQIMPGLLPALLVGLVFWALKKNVKPYLLNFGVMVLSIVLAALGILK